MIDVETARHYALSLPDVEEKDHFGMPSFRLKNKIFATLWIKDSRAMVKLSLVDQSVFCSYNSAVFFPVPGGWGTKGATFVDLKKVKKSMFKDALRTAYSQVAAPKGVPSGQRLQHSEKANSPGSRSGDDRSRDV